MTSWSGRACLPTDRRREPTLLQSPLPLEGVEVMERCDMIKIKRIYDIPSKGGGFRILVDRLWPRGLSKEKAKVDLWLKEIAPSNELRKWYGHDPKKWTEFRKKYFKELDMKKELANQIIQKTREGDVTLLYSSKEKKINNAVALKEYIIKHEAVE
jgi:uncharacterized protein YeaO (DUF488 family)